MSATRILIVEDEGIEALDIQLTLTEQGYLAPDIVSTGEEAIAKVEETSPDLVLMDIMLQGQIDGVTTAELIQNRFDIPIIYVTANTDPDTLQRAKLTEPYGYLVKPFNRRELYTSIDMALYKHSMKRKLIEREKWFSTTLRSIGDAIITTDKKGLITFLNPVAEQLTGWNQEEVLNHELAKAFNIANLYTGNPAETPVARVLADGLNIGLTNNVILIDRYNREIPIDYSVSPIKGEKDTINGVVLIFRDVTERYQVEKALRESEERYRVLAEERHKANQHKNNFLAMLSHELRNPLAAIRNGLDILEHAVTCEEREKRVKEVLSRQVGQLSRLVDDLLDITRINQNKIKLQKKRLELNELIKVTVEDHRLLFEEKELLLETNLASSDLFINADEARLAQIVGNLLQNAVKFSVPGGKIKVGVGFDSSQKQIVVRVKDTGVGITPELLSNMFRPFVQSEVTLDRSSGGLGLGLAICKGLVELHGGVISAQSDGLGKGSEFILCLPFEEVLIVEQETLSLGALPSSRQILIIEDNMDIAETFRELLELNHHKVAVAYNGSEGLSKALEFEPDVLLCDIGLPGMSGYDIAKAFREDERLKDVFLVAMTGYSLPEDLKQAFEAGFNCHLAKPVNLDKVKEVLAQVPDRIIN